MARRYDPWRDRRDAARPTPEARAHGDHILVEADRAGGKRTYNRMACPLDDCWHRGQIDEHQYAAGQRFEALARSQMIMRGPRSCLDWFPRGYGETESEYAVRRREAWVSLLHKLGKLRSFTLLGIVVDFAPTGRRRPGIRRWEQFQSGLTTAAEFFGV